MHNVHMCELTIVISLFNQMFCLNRVSIRSLTDVVHCPERFQPRRESSPYEVIVTLCITLVLLRGVVHTGVGRVVWRIFLLARQLYE